MNQVVTPEGSTTEVFDEIQVADAQALFDRALEQSEDDWEAAEELFAKSFDGMVELAREGDKTAQYNVALMYAHGINEPYDEDIDMLMEWVRENEEELGEYLDQLEGSIEEIQGRMSAESSQAEYSSGSSHDADNTKVPVDHDKDAKKLRRLYDLQRRLERQGFRTGANRDEYHEPEND